MLTISRYAVLAIAVVAASGCGSVDSRPARRFELAYRVAVRNFPAGARRLRVWLPIPASDGAQRISDLQVSSTVPHQITTEHVYGNKTAFFEVENPREPLSIDVTMEVVRYEATAVESFPVEPGIERLLAGDQLAPISDEVRLRAAAALGDRSVTPPSMRALYDKVLADVDYDKSGQGWGRGDIAYVCHAGKGNCSDFHALFIAMARSQGVPALFEIGFPLPSERGEGEIGGYHCWAWYREPSGVWRPVDASEADKNPAKRDYFFGTIDHDRVAFTRGRDLVLDPEPAAGPLNFLVDPHVEVDGRTDGVTIERRVSFRDL